MASGEQIGETVTISSDGNVVAVAGSALGPGTQTVVRVYENVNGNWVAFGQTLTGPEPNANLGSTCSLSSDGSTLAVPYNVDDDDSSSEFVQVDVYEMIANQWVQVGNTINESFDEDFGENIFASEIDLSADGQLFIIGSPSLNNFFGQADVYAFDGNTWGKSEIL